MMKIALVQFNPIVGDVDGNTQRIIDFITQASAAGADLAVFPELAVCGYPPLDLLDYPSFVQECELAVKKIAEHASGISVIVGAPELNHGKGKPVFNSAWYINARAEIEKKVRKTLLPDYDVFDESRYFESNTEFELFELKGKKLALTVCEDIWFNSPKKGFLNGGAGTYFINPLEKLKGLQPDLLINISASPFVAGKLEDRKKLLTACASSMNCTMVYVNQCGANTELIFDGASMVVSPQEEILFRMPSFMEKMEVLDVVETIPANNSIVYNKYEEIESALILGIRDFFRKQGFNKALLGLSGGVDSALTLYLTAKALGEDNVSPVMLPSPFSSAHSIDDSVELCRNLNCKVDKIEIDSIFRQVLESLKPIFGDRPFSLAEENIQARIRGTLLMGISNKLGYILLNTTNKSEMAVGYGTLYGDLCGGLSVLGDLYKTEVYELCNFINRNGEIIPANILSKAPSAELRPNQKDQDALPPYDLLDSVLKLFVEDRKSKTEIIAQGFEAAMVTKVIALVNASEYKRKQTPPVLKISEKAFGTGRRMPLVAKIK